MTATTSVAPAELQFDEADLDTSALRMLPGQAPSGGVADLAGMAYTYRHNWGGRNGWWLLTLNSADFGPNTRVFVSASEGPTPGGGKFVGSARYSVYNVAMEAGTVSIRVFIDWPSPIGLVVDYLIVNP